MAHDTQATKRRTASARWPLPALLSRVDRSGWGDLRGKQFHGLRAVLRGLVSHLDHRSGMGAATVPQVADAAGGYSVRWTRHLLGELEAIGAITWTRGGVVAGVAVPSQFRLSKRWLLALADGARVQRGDPGC